MQDKICLYFLYILQGIPVYLHLFYFHVCPIQICLHTGPCPQILGFFLSFF